MADRSPEQAYAEARYNLMARESAVFQTLRALRDHTVTQMKSSMRKGDTANFERLRMFARAVDDLLTQFEDLFPRMD